MCSLYPGLEGDQTKKTTNKGLKSILLVPHSNTVTRTNMVSHTNTLAHSNMVTHTNTVTHSNMVTHKYDMTGSQML